MKRRSRYKNSTIIRAKNSLREKQCSRIMTLLDIPITSQTVKDWASSYGGVSLRRGYDLRAPLAEKMLDASKVTKWTAFVNNRHNLVHLIPSDGSFLVRIQTYMSLKEVSDTKLSHVIISRFWG